MRVASSLVDVMMTGELYVILLRHQKFSGRSVTEVAQCCMLLVVRVLRTRHVLQEILQQDDGPTSQLKVCLSLLLNKRHMQDDLSLFTI